MPLPIPDLQEALIIDAAALPDSIPGLPNPNIRAIAPHIQHIDFFYYLTHYLSSANYGITIIEGIFILFLLLLNTSKVILNYNLRT